ncbi:hypothetical protein, partial [Klebsiella pneumoniae]|uniref:hypothetical protein n=1 Tax=Klebsiella pneumoniae TaxID=573 RepID=UPI0030076D77
IFRDCLNFPKKPAIIRVNRYTSKVSLKPAEPKASGLFHFLDVSITLPRVIRPARPGFFFSTSAMASASGPVRKNTRSPRCGDPMATSSPS